MRKVDKSVFIFIYIDLWPWMNPFALLALGTVQRKGQHCNITLWYNLLTKIILYNQLTSIVKPLSEYNQLNANGRELHYHLLISIEWPTKCNVKSTQNKRPTTWTNRMPKLLTFNVNQKYWFHWTMNVTQSL